MGRYDPLSGGDLRFTTHLVASHRPSQEMTAQRMGMLGPFLDIKSYLSVRNGVLLYKQLIRPMMDYACPARRSAARTHIRSYRCYNPNVFALLLVPPST